MIAAPVTSRSTATLRSSIHSIFYTWNSEYMAVRKILVSGCCAEEKIRRRRQLLSLFIQIKRKLKRRRKQKRNG